MSSSLEDLAISVRKLKKASLELVKGCIPIMQEIEDRDSDIISDYMKREGNEHHTKDSAQSSLREVSLALSKDARAVIDEIDMFEKFLMKGQTSLNQNADKYPFLASVWFGDVYGVSKTSALRKLAEEMRGTIDNLSEDLIVNEALLRRDP